ncbi:hypothetical protein F5884DRAFT_816827 [Xylogone sp. PMI_703]|nr:hypothetical protein F5884DRAFT_816827 [Xylogone sp. PMI_703]
MASDQPAQPTNDRPDRSHRRRPFSSWVKKLANFKSSSNSSGNYTTGGKRNTYRANGNSKRATFKNNPYPASGINGDAATHTNGHLSFSTAPTRRSSSSSSLDPPGGSVESSSDGEPPPTIGNKSVAATVSTDAATSHAPSSGEATTATAGYATSTGNGAGSTFSSPAPSVRSLTTTLTTMQSAAPMAQNASHHTGHNNNQSVQFTHQFPTSPIPNALPAHLAPHGNHPPTYHMVTANNLLTDNASILTLASSSKRHRRRSMDTDASVRALAPSSLFGGSRESLPLSVLSANIDGNTIGTAASLHQTRTNIGGPSERASVYSSTGIAPALASDRNSYYAGKQSIAADGSSVRSGLFGHGRQDSISGSVGNVGVSGSPLASPREVPPAGLLSRNNSGWGETGDDRPHGIYVEYMHRFSNQNANSRLVPRFAGHL